MAPASTTNSASSHHVPSRSTANRTGPGLAAVGGVDVRPRGRHRVEAGLVDGLTRALVDPVRATVDAFERSLELRELVLQLLEDREVLLAFEGLAGGVGGMLVVVGELREVVGLRLAELGAQLACQALDALLLGDDALTRLVEIHDDQGSRRVSPPDRPLLPRESQLEQVGFVGEQALETVEPRAGIVELEQLL